jgi:hypothetical protein
MVRGGGGSVAGGTMIHGGGGGGNVATYRGGADPGVGAGRFQGGAVGRGDSGTARDWRSAGRFHEDHRFHDGRDHRFRRFAFGGRAWPYDYDYGYDDSYYYSTSCYEFHRVHTRHGWELRRVWVCD